MKLKYILVDIKKNWLIKKYLNNNMQKIRVNVCENLPIIKTYHSSKSLVHQLNRLREGAGLVGSSPAYTALRSWDASTHGLSWVGVQEYLETMVGTVDEKYYWCTQNTK